MAQLIRPGAVKVVTQDGEVHVSISLELTINLNSDGLHVGAEAASNYKDVIDKPKEKAKKDDVMWEIPDFGTSPKVDFGKKQ